MNDDPSASNPADQPHFQDAYPVSEVDILQWEDTAPPSADLRQRQISKTRVQRKRRVEILDDVIRNFDIMIFCELSILYYLDCSLFRFLVRAFVEWFYFTPKPKIFPEPPRNRPYLGAVLGCNLICIFLHAVSPRPEAGEALRGYLHGGLLIDFVGQEGPISKSRLLVLDLLTLVLQLLVLTAFLERQNLKSSMTAPGDSSDAGAATDADANPQGQDHDSEERGILRSDPNTFEDIELQPLHSSAGRTGGEEDGERDELLSESRGLNPQDSTAHPLDAFFTGEHAIVDLHILNAVRTQRQLSMFNTGSDTGPSAASTAASLASNRFGIRMRFGGSGLRPT